MDTLDQRPARARRPAPLQAPGPTPIPGPAESAAPGTAFAPADRRAAGPGAESLPGRVDGQAGRPADAPAEAAATATDRPGGIASGLGDRIRAATIHLLISAAVAVLVLALVYFGWYRSPLDRLSGVGSIILLLLAVDVTLGPMMTLVVFNRQKRSLRFDMATIAALQVAALGYGLHAVEAGRPHYLVFVMDRFEVVSRSDLRPSDLAAAAGLDAARPSYLGPKLVSAEPFEDPKRRYELLLESVQGGRDLQHFPSQYRPIDASLAAIAASGQRLSELRRLNPTRSAEIDETLQRLGRDADALRFVPVKGPQGDAAILVDAGTGKPLEIADFKPWE